MNQQGRPTKPIEAIAVSPQTFTGNRALRIEEALIFEIGRPEVVIRVNAQDHIEEPSPERQSMRLSMNREYSILEAGVADALLIRVHIDP